jgi:hypothetical protein
MKHLKFSLSSRHSDLSSKLGAPRTGAEMV